MGAQDSRGSRDDLRTKTEPRGWRDRRRFEVTLMTVDIPKKAGSGVPVMDKLAACQAKALEPFHMVGWRMVDPKEDEVDPKVSAAVSALDALIAEAKSVRADLVDNEPPETEDDLPWAGDLEDLGRKVDDAIAEIPVDTDVD